MATKTAIKDYPVIELNVNDIKKDPTNPNTMTLEQERGLEKSIVKFGRLKHIVVDQDNVLIDGEHRLEVEKANGTQTVNVIQVNVKDEIERKMMRETLNKLHGTYNKEKESSELLAIFENQKLDELAELLAQPKQELENLISRYNPDIHFEREEDDSKLPSLYDTESFVNKGEIWKLGTHYLMCGDSHNDLPILLENIKPDLLLTDPPYGIGIVNQERSHLSSAHKFVWNDAKIGFGKVGTKGLVPAKEYKTIQNDDVDFNPTFLLDYAKSIIIFGANHFANKLPNNSHWIVWDKKEGIGADDNNFSDVELAWTNIDQKSARIYRHLWSGLLRKGDRKSELKDRVHPTQKPVKLLADIIKDYSNDNDIILDPFLGSGSTLIACEQTNRICMGCEIDEHYCSVIIKRWELYTGLKAEKV
jgi:DNA modification methylase